MKDWNLMAKAAGLDIPAQEADRLAGPLNALEDAFRPLVRSLTPEMEPAAAFRADEEQA